MEDNLKIIKAGDFDSETMESPMYFDFISHRWEWQSKLSEGIPDDYPIIVREKPKAWTVGTNPSGVVFLKYKMDLSFNASSLRAFVEYDQAIEALVNHLNETGFELDQHSAKTEDADQDDTCQCDCHYVGGLAHTESCVKECIDD